MLEQLLKQAKPALIIQIVRKTGQKVPSEPATRTVNADIRRRNLQDGPAFRGVRIAHAVIALLALLLATALPAPVDSAPKAMRTGPTGAALTAEETDRLGRLEILSALVDNGSPIKDAVAVGVIEAPPEKVFATVCDYEHGPEFLPYVARSAVLRTDGRLFLTQWLEFPLGIGNRHYTVEITESAPMRDGVPVLTQSWAYTGTGNIKDTTGSWEVCAWGSGNSLLRYTVHSDPGGSLPTWAKNSASRVALPKLIKAIRTRVASPQARVPGTPPP